MTLVHHVSPDPDPARRGAEFGRVRRDEVEATVAAYLGLFRRHVGLDLPDVLRRGAEVREVLTGAAPSAAAEVTAIAEGSEQPVDLLMALNARTELLAGAPECTVLADVGCGTLAQNWDYHPDVRRDRVLWSVRTEHGWITTMTEAGLLAKVGLNDRGLAVALNVLSTAHDGGTPGVPVHVLLRQVLDSCADVADAVRLLRGAPVSSSNAISLLGPASSTDRAPRAVTCEVTPAGFGLVEPEEQILVHTNHCRESSLTAADRTAEDYPDTVHRLERARALIETSRPDEIASVLTDHAADRRGICRHDDEAEDLDQSVTLASVVMQPARPVMLVSDGAPCEAAYEAVGLPWASPR